jgi:uncharacterized protein YacL
MGNNGIKALIGVLIFAVVAALIVVVLQQVMVAFNFTGTFATILTLIFGSVVGLFIAILVLSKIADQF